MKKQDRGEANDQQSVIEDLTVNEAEANQVKGGPKIKLNTDNCGG